MYSKFLWKNSPSSKVVNNQCIDHWPLQSRKAICLDDSVLGFVVHHLCKFI